MIGFGIGVIGSIGSTGLNEPNLFSLKDYWLDLIRQSIHDHFAKNIPKAKLLFVQCGVLIDVTLCA